VGLLGRWARAAVCAWSPPLPQHRNPVFAGARGAVCKPRACVPWLRVCRLPSAGLSQLTSLVASCNNFTVLPTTMEGLQTLSTLVLSDNPLGPSAALFRPNALSSLR
jgi:hypothetical protein